MIKDPGRRVVDAFDRAEAAIVELASKVAGLVGAMAARAVAPEKLQISLIPKRDCRKLARYCRVAA